MNIKQRAEAGEIAVDEADLAKYGHWTCSIGEPHTGYKQLVVYDPSKIPQRSQHFGRLLLNCPAHLEVDHRDRNSLNFTRDNLRLATHSENCANQDKRKTNKSGYKGVYFEKQTGRYRAALTVEGQSFKLGRFDCPIAAAKAYDQAARYHVGEVAKLNFPGEVGEQI